MSSIGLKRNEIQQNAVKYRISIPCLPDTCPNSTSGFMETFGHIKTVLQASCGISITHILKGNVKLIEHPGKYKPYWIHTCYGVLYLFLLLIHFWWWEIYLNNIKTWVFSQYFFLILYSTMYYVLCCFLIEIKIILITKTYFYSRRKWFSGMLAVTFCSDFCRYFAGKERLPGAPALEIPVRNITLAARLNTQADAAISAPTEG